MRRILIRTYIIGIRIVEAFMLVPIVGLSIVMALCIRIFRLFGHQSPEGVPRVVVGLNEIADHITSCGNAFRKMGWDVETIAIPSRFFLERPYEVVLNVPQWAERVPHGSHVYQDIHLALLFLRCLLTRNFFVFTWNISFFPLNVDLFVLRLAGYPALIFHQGDDVRYRPIQRHVDEKLLDSAFWIAPQRDFYRFLRAFMTQTIAELSRYPIASMRNQATFQGRDLHVFKFSVSGVLSGAKNSRAPPSIVHAPSRRSDKGTAVVLEAIKILRARGRSFNFELIEDKPNTYVLEQILQADIVIDQPGVWCGRLAVEAMAASCVVLGGNRPDYERYGVPSPVIQFERDPEALASALDMLLCDSEHRQQKMKESFSYWEREYSPEAFARYLEELIAGTAPTFSPLPEHKAILLEGAQSAAERWVIRLFYHGR